MISPFARCLAFNVAALRLVKRAAPKYATSCNGPPCAVASAPFAIAALLGTLGHWNRDKCPERLVQQSERQERVDRICPWCASAEVRFVQRGYAGLTDERDQYVVCDACHKTTYEIVAKTSREMRLGRYKPGDIYQDRAQNTRYAISRVLRSGSNEFLVYLKPLTERAGAVH